MVSSLVFHFFVGTLTASTTATRKSHSSGNSNHQFAKLCLYLLDMMPYKGNSSMSHVMFRIKINELMQETWQYND